MYYENNSTSPAYLQEVKGIREMLFMERPYNHKSLPVYHMVKSHSHYRRWHAAMDKGLGNRSGDLRSTPG